MARDQYEYDVGGELRDRYGRPQYVVVAKHTAPLSTDDSRAYQPTDGDGRLQIVHANAPYSVVNGFTDVAISAALSALPTITHPTLGSIQWGTVILPPGTYTFSNTITLPSYVHIEGFKRAILTRANGFNGLLFRASAAITNFGLNGLVWDNGGTANQMFQFPVGCVGFDMLWARFQNTNGPVGQFLGSAGGSVLSSDLTIRDIRLLGTGVIANQPGLILLDVSDVVCENFKTYPDTGQTQALNAIKIETTGNCTTPSRNIRVEGIEAEHCNETVVLIRNNGSGQMENVTVKSIVGEHIGSSSTQKGLVDIGEQVGGSALSSSLHGFTVESVVGRDWYGHLVNVGGGAQNGDVGDFTIAGIRGDSANYSTGVVDTTKVNTVLNVVGCHNGEIDGVVARNTGSAGVRFANGVGSVFCSTIEGAGIDVESCVQNPSLVSPSTWQIGGVFLDYGCSNIKLKGRSANNYSAANPGGTQVGAGVACITGAAAQCNDITLDFICTDTRAGGSQFQDVGVRIGQSDSDGNQPNRWMVVGGDVRNNGVQATKTYGTTDHGHIIFGNKGAIGSIFCREDLTNAARNVLAETVPMVAVGEGASTTSALATQELTGGLVGLLTGDVVKGIAFNLTVAAVTMTLFKVGLYDTSGNLLASSADQSGTINSTGMKQIAFSSPFTVVTTGAYYLSVLCVFSAGTVSIDRGRASSAMALAIDSGKTPIAKQVSQLDIPSPATWAAGNTAQAAYHFMAYS